MKKFKLVGLTAEVKGMSKENHNLLKSLVGKEVTETDNTDSVDGTPLMAIEGGGDPYWRGFLVLEPITTPTPQTKVKFKGLVGESSIMLKYGEEVINIQKETDRYLYEEFKDLLKENNEQKLIEKFLNVKERIDKYTNKVFEVKQQALYFKGDTEPLPDNIAKKLLELESNKEDFMPLVRFWKKLKENPSKESIAQLYGFMLHNNIGLSESGDIVVEKGVNQKVGAPVGELVDCHTGRVDNSIGMEVFMERDKVDSDPNRTCSHGLHVGAPDYVRRHYGGNIIVKCLVNPRDVVSVPVDYNNTKMRVCRYTVVGYSDKSNYKPVYSLSDFLQTPLPQDVEAMEKISTNTPVKKGVDPDVVSKKSKKDKVPSKLLNKYSKKFSVMKAKEVMDYVEKKFGIVMEYSPKSKAAIVKAAAKIAANDEEIRKM